MGVSGIRGQRSEVRNQKNHFTAKNAKKRIERKEETDVIASKAKRSSDFSLRTIFWIASLCSQ
ncbi:MAG: hypothetical protein FWC38_03335 [Proteobacteria bacterium]|nr:hypothetical protein [Pseudomonadota bacterium]